jgi:ribose transport system ATP-binding protein
MARRGKAIILVSSELSELLAASDRIAVMAGGRITREVARRDIGGGQGAPEEAEHRLQLLLQEAAPVA